MRSGSIAVHIVERNVIVGSRSRRDRRLILTKLVSDEPGPTRRRRDWREVNTS